MLRVVEELLAGGLTARSIPLTSGKAAAPSPRNHPSRRYSQGGNFVRGSSPQSWQSIAGAKSHSAKLIPALQDDVEQAPSDEQASPNLAAPTRRGAAVAEPPTRSAARRPTHIPSSRTPPPGRNPRTAARSPAAKSRRTAAAPLPREWRGSPRRAAALDRVAHGAKVLEISPWNLLVASVRHHFMAQRIQRDQPEWNHSAARAGKLEHPRARHVPHSRAGAATCRFLRAPPGASGAPRVGLIVIGCRVTLRDAVAGSL
jgi:hypothetical protein